MVINECYLEKVAVALNREIENEASYWSVGEVKSIMKTVIDEEDVDFLDCLTEWRAIRRVKK